MRNSLIFVRYFNRKLMYLRLKPNVTNTHSNKRINNLLESLINTFCVGKCISNSSSFSTVQGINARLRDLARHDSHLGINSTIYISCMYSYFGQFELLFQRQQESARSIHEISSKVLLCVIIHITYIYTECSEFQLRVTGSLAMFAH